MSILLFYAQNYDNPIIMPTKPSIAQQQALAIVEQDLQSRESEEIREVMTFKDKDDFEMRGYVPYAELKRSSDLQLPLVFSNPNSPSVIVIVSKTGELIAQDCSESPDALICIVSCFSKGELFWVVDIFSEYYAVHAVSGDILFSQSRQALLMEKDPAVAGCLNASGTTSR